MLINWIFFLISLHGVQKILFPGPTVRVAIEFIISIIIGYIFFTIKGYLGAQKLEKKNIVVIFAWYGVFVVLHSAYVADSYEQWRYLVTVFMPTLLFPIFCILGASLNNFLLSFRYMVFYTSIMAVVFLMHGPTDKLFNLNYLKYISYTYPLIIFSPVMPGGVVLLVMGLAASSLMFDFENRSNMLSIFASLVFLGVYYFLLNMKKDGMQLINKFFGSIRLAFLCVPVFLLILGSLGLYNVFESAGESDELVVVGTENGPAIRTVDSRTTIYEDAMRNISKNNAWVIGTSATYLYETGLASTLEGYDGGRLGGSESGFIGFLTFGGVIYVGIVFSIFYSASYLAIYKSNSILMKVIGLYLAFRWLFMFIESPVEFNMYWISTFILIGVVLGNELRSMGDVEIRNYFMRNFKL